MKSWNEIRKAATAFSKRWKNAFDEKAQAQSLLVGGFEILSRRMGGLSASCTDADRVAHLFKLYAEKARRQ